MVLPPLIEFRPLCSAGHPFQPGAVVVGWEPCCCRGFVAPAGPFLPQAIYPVMHPALGTMEIFLVPVGPLAGGNGYHAVFT